MDLHQLIYLSRATKKMASDELLAILQTAKENNAKIDVTGSLYYNGGWFLQVLEGDKAVIQRLYDKIAKDTRHAQSRLLHLEPAKFRSFSQWTMNMVNLEQEKPDKFQELKAVIEAASKGENIGHMSPAVKLLSIFRQ